MTTYSGSTSGSSSGAPTGPAGGAPGRGAASRAGRDAAAATAAAAAVCSYDKYYMHIHNIIAKKFAYLLQHMICSFKNMTYSKKNIYLLREYGISYQKYDLFQECMRALMSLDPVSGRMRSHLL